MTQTIQDKLNRLSEMQAQADVIRLHYEKLRADLIPPEIQQQLDDMDAEYQTSIEILNGGIAELTAEVKQDVLAHGSTVKADHLQAVWVKGRVSWDNKKLDGLMIVFPELKRARKEGDPSVSLRKV